MTKNEAENVLRELLTLEVEDGGTIYEISLYDDLDITSPAVSVNSLSTKIAYMEKIVAKLKRETKSLISEREEWWAAEDKEVRKLTLYSRGEEKIKQAIRRRDGFIERQNAVEEAQERQEIAEGYLRALYVAAEMVRTKDSTLRKQGEMVDTVEDYHKAKKFNIERRGEAVREKINKTKKKKRKSKKKAVEDDD